MTDTKLSPYPKRTISISLSDDDLDALDTFVLMTDAESRSAVVREFIRLGLSLHDAPTETLPRLLNAMISAFEAQANAEALPAGAGM